MLKRIERRTVWAMVVAAGICLCASMTAQAAAPNGEIPVGLWPIKTLVPAGSDEAAAGRPLVALAGDTAVTVYTGNDEFAGRAYTRSRLDASTWSAPRLLAQGTLGDGFGAALSASDDWIAIGSPTENGGKVEIFKRDAVGDWQPSAVINSPEILSEFGDKISVAGDLLIVRGSAPNGNTGTNGARAYRYDADAGAWIATYSLDDFFGEQSYGMQVATDGTRISICQSLPGCQSLTRMSDNDWQVEASGTSAGGGDDLAIHGDWLATIVPSLGVKLAHRDGIHWSAVQTIPCADPSANSFALDQNQLLISCGYSPSTFEIWDLQGSTWILTFESDRSPWGSTSLRGDTALVGTQSYLRVGTEWQSSGTVWGQPDVEAARFGEAITLAGNRIWVDESGGDALAVDGGDILRYSLADASTEPFGPALGPLDLSIGETFGRVLASDGATVVALADSDRVEVMDGATGATLQELMMPENGTSFYFLSADVHDDTIAVARGGDGNFGTVSRIDLFERENGGPFALNQAIEIPAGVAPDSEFARSLIIRGEWLLSGDVLFQRSVDGYYEFVRELEKLPGFRGNFSETAAGNTVLMAPINSPFDDDPLAMVYALDTGSGWELRGALTGPGRYDCTVLAVQDDRAACATGTADSTSSATILMSRPDAGEGNWSVVGKSQSFDPVPSALAILGDHVVVGLPSTNASGPSGTASMAGKVIVFTTDESIFVSGFDATP